MTLKYYGHCAFLWSSPGGVRCLIDPFGNSPRNHWFVRPFPPVEADVVMVTHDHFDHNAVREIPGLPTVLRGPGEFRHEDILVRGVLDLHSGRSGRAGLSNTMFVVESEGVRYCHIGDNRHDIPDDARAQVGRVDVLMVTVDDSCHLLTYEQVDALIASIAPRVVVPMHYYIEGLTAESSTLKPPDAWLSKQSNVRRLDADSVQLTRRDLPADQEVWVFRPPPLP